VIYEKLDCLTVDLERLRRHLYDHVMRLPPQMQAHTFGGWSIQSASGDYTDGWQKGYKCYTPDPLTGNMKFDAEKAARIGLKPTSDYIKPTQINFGYVTEVIEQIEALGLKPRRARFSLLKGYGKSRLHRDAPDDVYSVRLHIPIITNETCTFESNGEAAHLAADGSVYILYVNRLHQIFNRRPEDRVHMMADVCDTRGVTKYHRYVPETKTFAMEAGTEPHGSQIASLANFATLRSTSAR
jgi:hypothetical protein